MGAGVLVPRVGKWPQRLQQRPPVQATEALKRAMLLAVQEDLAWLVGHGQAPSAEQPVVDREVQVTAYHLQSAGWVAPDRAQE